MQQGEGGEAGRREEWLQAAMLYGIAPNLVGGTEKPELYEKWRPLFRRYMPVIIALGEAGWEPVTWVTVQPETVQVERFGPRHGEVYLTVRNPGAQALAVTLTLDRAALQLAGPLQAVRLPDGRAVTLAQDQLRDTLAGGETCAYRIGP
jgi:hypothetical protein